jgi:hypothetical protein
VTVVAPDAEDYASQIAALLWPESAEGGKAPSGSPLLSLPSAAKPRLLFTSGSRRVAASAIRRYNVPAGRRERVTTSLVAGGLRTGALQFFARSRLTLPSAKADSGGITAFLRSILSPRCEVVVYVGIPRRNRKPVLLVLEPDGALIAVGKLAVSPLTSTLVRNEAAALRRVGEAGVAGMIVPSVLFAGEWSGHELLVQSALPRLRRPPSDAERQRDEGAARISAIGGLRHVRLRVSGVLEQLAQRGSLLPAGREQALVATSLEELRAKAGTVEIPVGSWHGDWAPWNHGATTNGLLVWDWERFASGVPAGYDALHCAAQAFAARHGDPQAALADVHARLDPLLRPFGVVPFAQLSVFALYLIEILVRYTEDSQAEAESGRRWVDALVSQLTRVNALLDDGNLT